MEIIPGAVCRGNELGNYYTNRKIYSILEVCTAAQSFAQLPRSGKLYRLLEQFPRKRAKVVLQFGSSHRHLIQIKLKFPMKYELLLAAKLRL